MSVLRSVGSHRLQSITLLPLALCPVACSFDYSRRVLRTGGLSYVSKSGDLSAASANWSEARYGRRPKQQAHHTVTSYRRRPPTLITGASAGCSVLPHRGTPSPPGARGTLRRTYPPRASLPSGTPRSWRR